MRTRGTVGWAALLLVAVVGAYLGWRPLPPRESAQATYIGRAACAECHAPEAQLFEGSHHDLAMQPAVEGTVLGDFAESSYDHFGVRTTFRRRDGRFLVETDGAEYEVAYTFGVYPLQQYLIPMSGGRYQALSVAWDARPKEQGGQRWFHLYPDEPIPEGDILHWAGPAQNWNHMCAECHSTNVQKGWRDGQYQTTWSEIDVSCEACHGPGSAHADAERRGRGLGRGLLAHPKEPPAAWIMDGATGIARRERPRTSNAEIETCARCHARRSALFEECLPGRPLLETHKPALLSEGLYFADGQQQEEVFEYGSFLQSKMHAAGVSCGDCHNPHSLGVPGGRDKVCAGCHTPERFDTPAHHHHAPGGAGASCVACHMPTRNYMVVHARRDHSFRVPRPDLGEKLGAPDACTGCHSDKGVRWTREAVEKWYPDGRWKKPHYGETLHAGRRGEPGAELALARLVDDPEQPAIVRASALELLGGLLSPASLGAVARGLADSDGLVRAAAIDALPAPEAVAPLLSDPLRIVRIEAASALAGAAHLLTGERRSALDLALGEYRAAQAVNADRPEAHSNLGSLEVRLGNRAAARRAYEEGLRVGPWFAGLWINFADLLREEGDDAEGERLLRRGLEAAAAKAELHHALGLNLARQKRMEEALEELRRGMEGAPANAHFAYVYGVALLSLQRPDEALAVFAAALARRPGDRELLVALATTHRDRGDIERAHAYARRLVDVSPGDRAAQRLLEELEAVAKGNR